jgi:sortase (surface protein transpeptidase)
VIDASSFWLGAIVPPAAVVTEEPQASTLPRSKPVTLDIPSIGVHSAVQYLGQTAEGALETPAPGPLYDTAAWYRYSPTPGSLGPAILMGHIDSAWNGPSVFFRLGELRPGDRVSITRADDSVAVFVVDRVSSYAKDDFPTDLVYGDIDHAGLRLITCGGAFDDATGHYLDNIVVFATLEI